MVVIERSTAPNGFFGPFLSVRIISGAWYGADTKTVGWVQALDRVVAYDPQKHQRLISVTVELTEEEVRARALELTDDLNRPGFYSAKDKFGKACQEVLKKHGA